MFFVGHIIVNHELGFYPVNRRMDFRPSAASDLANTVCALQQSPEYARALRQIGADVEMVTAWSRSDQLARCLIVRRKLGPLPLAWLPRGPVWAPAAAAEDRAAVFRALPQLASPGSIWVTNPDTPDDADQLRHTRLLSSQHMAEIDLTLPQEARMARQHGKWRNRLRHARLQDLGVAHRRFDNTRDFDLLQREMTQQKARRYRGLPPEFVLGWAAANPNAIRVFTASRSGTALAHMLILLHHPTATYHIGWTSREGRTVSAHNLLLWHVANWLADHGHRRFDLGHVDTEHAPGLARFKIGSGARVRALGPTCLRLPRPSFKRRIRHDAA